MSMLRQPASGIESPEFAFEQTPSGKVGGFIISHTFEPMTQLDRQNMVWEFLEKQLPVEKVLKIVTLVTVTPEETQNGTNCEQGNTG